MGRPLTPAVERFDAKYAPEPMSGCWLWLGALDRDGYGRFRVDWRDQPMGAHRASWLLHCGAIPDDKMVLHRCDVRCCVNPDHLFLGDAMANWRDCVAKQRDARGTRHPHALLTETDVRAIRDAIATGAVLADLARQYRVAHATICNIRDRRSWKLAA